MIAAHEISAIMDRYYSEHMGYPISDVPPGGVVVSAYAPDRREPGGGTPPDIRLMLFDDRVLAAVRADLKPAVERVLSEMPVPGALLTIGFQSRIAGLVDTLPRENRLQVLYAPSAPRLPRDSHACRRLLPTDIWEVKAWFRDVDPGKDMTEQMASAERSIREGIAFGAFHGDRMIALARTLLPHYLEGLVEDVAIRTSEKYRRHGYGSNLVALQTHAILELDRVPMYRCTWNNEASLGVALKLGYRRYASLISFMRSSVPPRPEAPEE